MARIPKPTALLQRRNRSATRATLPTAESSAENEVPPLPPSPEMAQPQEARKGSSTQRGYGVEHRKWRKEVLAKHPKCVDCGDPATEADHIVPTSKGGERLALENGAGRCGLCHAAKTARDQKLYVPSPTAGWHPMVSAWWDSVWRSPMASEYLDTDMKGGLFQLAVLHQDFWTADSPGKRLSAAAEIRLQEVRFGLSPIDRRRLQWTVEQGEVAAERTEARRQSKRPPKAGTDPRSVLKAV